MAESNKGHKSKPAPPPWANKLKSRRNTTQTQPPPKPTGSNRAVRYAPIKPKKKSFKTKPPWPPKKPTPTQSTTTSVNAPKSKFSQRSSTYKPTPLLIKQADINDNNNNNTQSKPLKRASLQHTTLSQIIGKHQSKSSNNMIKSKSYPKNVGIKSKSPPPPNNNNDNKDEPVSRWKNNPHAQLHAQLYGKLQEDEKSKAGPPPPPGQQPRHKPVDAQEETNRKYLRNIAGFDEKTLGNIDKCNVEALLGCMHEGSECLKHFHKALTTFGKQQQTQCANFLKLFKKSKSRYAQLDMMPNFFYAISLIHTLLEETVKQSAEFAKFIQISCLPMISELENQCDEKYKEIYNATKVQNKKLSDSRSDVEKQKKISKTAAEKVIIARQKNEVHKQNEKLKLSSNYHNKHTSILSNVMIASNKHGSASIRDAYIVAKEQEKKFKANVVEYNTNRMDFINKRNEGKHEIINMEHFRVDSMLTVFQKIVGQQRKAAGHDHNKVYQLQNDIETHTNNMKPKDVLSKFINLSIDTHGEWKPPEAIESTLEIEYRDMFHSIEDAMNITLEINKDAKIPLVVPLLCERIKDLNGFKTEGIFRKSPNKSNMMRIKKRLQVKNFQLDEDNVHVYSALLKEWLRGLDDLLIPKRYYDYCVSMAKENKLNRQQFEVFFSGLPSVNRECLKYLVTFLRELLKPQYKQYTKMGLENIAIVFGPTLLMPPTELEPTEALQNAKAEKQFVVSLIENS